MNPILHPAGILALAAFASTPAGADITAWGGAAQAAHAKPKSALASLVYRRTREYMPALPGMTPEHISLRKDRITFKYTFR